MEIRSRDSFVIPLLIEENRAKFFHGGGGGSSIVKVPEDVPPARVCFFKPSHSDPGKGRKSKIAEKLNLVKTFMMIYGLSGAQLGGGLWGSRFLPFFQKGKSVLFRGKTVLN